jgi:alkylation response protein AidB-like acyl-CoA dehydrogenase
VDRALAEAGWLGFSWPTEFGGAGGAPTMTAITDEERGLAGIPAASSPSRFGINLLGPTLMRHGTEDQQRRFLPPILRAEDLWCQGFSEPEAGSDLAGVRCFVRDDGDCLRLTGSKIWTTQAPEVDWCFALVRTENGAGRHRNLSFVLVSMKEPGIEIQPLRQLTGDAEFSQVFFDGVRVEHDNVIGAPGEGWPVAMTTLSAERSYAQLSRYRAYRSQLERIVELFADDNGGLSGTWAEDLGRIYADLTGIRNLSFKIASLATAGEDLAALPSVTKLWWSESHQRLVEFGYRAAVHTRHDEAYWYRLALQSRAETLYAGSSEIQRNIIAERMLGLPR